MNILHISKNKRRWTALLIIAVLFFIGTSSFYFLAQKQNFYKWLSPDESANFIFAKLYGEQGDLRIFEPYNFYAGDVIHPRSMYSDQGKLKPMSFLGLPLIYGTIASVTSFKILPFLTPLIGALGILLYYLLVEKIFGRRVAFISAVLLASFPVYIYYSARSMFHNILFTVLLLAALYFSILMAKKSEDKYLPWVYAILAGLACGLAIITRTSELIWLLPVLFILWLTNFKKIGLLKLVIFLASIGLAILPAAYWNQLLYGAPWHGGYQEMNQSLETIVSAGSNLAGSAVQANWQALKDMALKVKDNVFYFGFHPRQSAQMFYYYGLQMFWWLSIPAILGFLFFAANQAKLQKKHLIYLTVYLVASAILVLYYGSWKFNDNPDPAAFTIGNSYTRYWLPLYLGALPFASMFIMWLTRQAKKNFLIGLGRAVILTAIFVGSVYFVFVGSEEGLLYAYNNQIKAKPELKRVLTLTESNAVIITRYHDKLLFPERRVIVGWFDDKVMIEKYEILTRYLPIYLYNFSFTEKDFQYLNNKRLAELGLRLEKVEDVTQEFSLYKFYPVE